MAMPKRQRFFRWIRQNRISAILIFVVIALLCSSGVRKIITSYQQRIEFTGTALQMREEPTTWTKTQRNVDAMLQDLNAGNVQAVGLGQDAILVSTKAGDKYAVPDQMRYFTPIVLKQLELRRDAVPGETERAPEILVAESAGINGNVHMETVDSSPPFLLVNLTDERLIDPPWLSETTLRLFSTLVTTAFLGFFMYLMLGNEGRKSAGLVTQPSDTTFDDVIGVTEAKQALKDIVAFMRDPEPFNALGAVPPKGVLMAGPPGVGKTLLAKALANECEANFIAIDGGEFSSKFVGMGGERVKSIFKKARRNAPCVLFIDEIDGIAKRSTDGSFIANEANRIINQVLIQMDGFETKERVIVVGATNLLENVEPALLREGRFDRKIYVSLPNVKDREQILLLYAKGITVASDVDYPLLARKTLGLAPSALAFLVKHAALVAARERSESVQMKHFQEAIDTIRIGEKKEGVQDWSDQNRYRIAVHEAGHAVIAELNEPGSVEKVTISPRGQALGSTSVLSQEDMPLYSESELKKRIMMLLAGRGSELIWLNSASTGAANDLAEATKLAVAMVGKFGLGDSPSLLSLDSLDAALQVQYSKSVIEKANALLAELDRQCQQLLQEHSPTVMWLTQQLLDEETVSGDSMSAQLHLRTINA